jgi:tudor domain-containing protein 3
MSNSEQNGVKDNNQPRHLPQNYTRQPRNENPPHFQRDTQNLKSVLEGSGLLRHRSAKRPSTSPGPLVWAQERIKGNRPYSRYDRTKETSYLLGYQHKKKR